MYTPADIERSIFEKYNLQPFSFISEETCEKIKEATDDILMDMSLKNLCRAGIKLKDLLRSADSVYKFIEGCRRTDDYTKWITDDGAYPFRQVEQYLVLLTAQTQFNKYLPEGMDARKFTLIRPCFFFSWQLTFLSEYEALEDRVILELGPDLLEIRTKKSFEALLRLSIDDISQAKKFLQEKFVDVLRISPNGLRNVIVCPPNLYKDLEGILGEDIFFFMCRDTEFFKDVMQTPIDIMRLFSRDLARIAPTAFKRIAYMPSDKAHVFLKHLIGKYPFVRRLFTSPYFCETVLKKSIESLMQIDSDNIPFDEFVRLKVLALKPLLDEKAARLVNKKIK